MTLINAIPNRTYVIVDFNGGPNLIQRLYSMGLYPGARIQIVSVAPLRGPLMIKNLDNNIQIALGRGIVSKISVREG